MAKRSKNNPDGKKPVVGGNTFVVVEADGDDLVHSDGKTAAKAVELIRRTHGTNHSGSALALFVRTCPSSHHAAITSHSCPTKR